MVGGLDIVLSNAGAAAIDMGHRAIDYSHAQVNDEQVKETQRTQIFELPMMRKPGYADQVVRNGTIGAVVQPVACKSSDPTVGHQLKLSA